MSIERTLASALVGTITVAAAIIITQEIHIQEIESELAREKRISKIWKKAVLKMHRTADVATLMEVNEMLGNDIAFEKIIKDF